MGRNKLFKIQDEVEEIQQRFVGNPFMLTQAFLQIIHRENILTGNRLRRRYGEPEITPEPVMYQQKDNQPKVEWVIDVPQEWYSLTGKY